MHFQWFINKSSRQGFINQKNLCREPLHIYIALTTLSLVVGCDAGLPQLRQVGERRESDHIGDRPVAGPELEQNRPILYVTPTTIEPPMGSMIRVFLDPSHEGRAADILPVACLEAPVDRTPP
jgi:hypothetical protein